MIKLTPQDIHPLDAFAPQEALNKVNEAVRQKIKEVCFAKGHVWELYKRGAIINDYNNSQFEALQWSHRCRFCECELRPIAFEEV